jgi:hypothetical protein
LIVIETAKQGKRRHTKIQLYFLSVCAESKSENLSFGEMEEDNGVTTTKKKLNQPAFEEPSTLPTL